MACCDNCGNFDSSHMQDLQDTYQAHNPNDYQPDLYYYWDAPLDEDYISRDAFPHANCLCPICFDVITEEGQLK